MQNTKLDTMFLEGKMGELKKAKKNNTTFDSKIINKILNNYKKQLNEIKKKEYSLADVKIYKQKFKDKLNSLQNKYDILKQEIAILEGKLEQAQLKGKTENILNKRKEKLKEKAISLQFKIDDTREYYGSLKYLEKEM